MLAAHFKRQSAANNGSIFIARQVREEKARAAINGEGRVGHVSVTSHALHRLLSSPIVFQLRGEGVEVTLRTGFGKKKTSKFYTSQFYILEETVILHFT